MLALFLELPQLPHDAEDDLAGAAGFGVGDGEIGRHLWVEVMVEEHDDAMGGEQGRLHLVDTARGIEVEAEYEVGNLQEQVALLASLIISDNLLCIRHPMEEVGVLIGHDDRRLLAHGTEELSPSEA